MRYSTAIYAILAVCLAIAVFAGTAHSQALPDTGLGYGYISGESDPPPVTDFSTLEFDTNATADELLESARAMFLADNYALAEMLYKAALIREPNHLSAMLELAVIYEATGKLQYARGLLTRALILKPYDQEIIDKSNDVARKLSASLEADVDSLLARNAYAEALPKLSVLLTTQPENAELHYRKAQCHLALHDPASAVTEIEKAIVLVKEDRYFALRTDAIAIKKMTEIGELTDEARILMESGTPGDRNQVLALLSRILARDPDHDWARQQFLMLTEGGAQPGAPAASGDAQDRFTGLIKAGAERVSSFAGGVIDTLRRHLNVLLLAFAVLVIFGSPLTYMIVRGFEPHQSLSGRLSQFKIRDVLTMINSQGRTGVLRIYAESGKGRVYFESGEVHHCTYRDIEGADALRKIIETASDGHFVFTKPPRSVPTTIETPLSIILVDLAEREQRLNTDKPVSCPAPTQKKKSKMKTLLESKT